METNPTMLLDCPLVTSDDIWRKQEIGDPYTYVLCENFLPPVGSTDIFNYLVLSSSFCTAERFKAYKSLDAYKYFVSGFVSGIGCSKVGDKCVIIGKVSK